MKRQAVVALAVIAGILAPVQVFAGELVRIPRINNNSNVGNRDIKRSTFAVQALDRGLGNRDRVIPLQTSNPFEARILDYQRAQLKYEQDLGRWQAKVAKMEETKDQKAAKEQEQANLKRVRELEKSQREKNRAVRHDKRDVLAALRGDKEPNVISDEEEKSRKAEAFFGTSKDGPKQEKPTLSFWQRLKRAVFGS